MSKEIIQDHYKRFVGKTESRIDGEKQAKIDNREII
jgi:hypothetical protein